MTRRRDESLNEWIERTEMQAAAREVRQHLVYRALDSYGLLLYIGCTGNLVQRMGQHASGSAWHRYAETIATVTYPTRSSALAAESEAIRAEASYFNATVDDMVRTNANRTTAQRNVRLRGIQRPDLDLERVEDPAYLAEHDAAYDFWDAAVEREKARLKTCGARAYLTDEDRLARYLAAREDAELARLEVAA